MPTSTTQGQPQNATIGLWIVDTRPWYPQVTQTKQLETHAARALALVPAESRTKILHYYHVRDAKMALGSALLKHYAVTRLHGIPWTRTLRSIRSDGLTKPVFVDPDTGAEPVPFNVSHQAGIVVIAAVAGYRAAPGGGAELGVDVVCTSERRARDREALRRGGPAGWLEFVDMHADVLAPGEVDFLKHRVLAAVPGLLPAPSPAAGDVADAKLRAFYALWALREAYVKLTGEALTAQWLHQLEFRGFRPSRPTPGWHVPAREDDDDGDGDGMGGEVVRDMEIWFKGQRLRDVNMCLRSVGEDFMIATAVRTPGRQEDALAWKLGPYEELTLDELLDFAEASG